jgi:hypothetical protein
MTPSEQIDQQIAEFSDWRGALVAQIRKTVLASNPGITEDVKWGVPVWLNSGLVCSAGVMKSHVKMNFFQGASLDDPDGLFNAGLEAKKTRAIDFYESDVINESKLSQLIKSAVAFNQK